MLKDRQGNAMSGATPEAVALFDAAVGAFNIYRGDPIGLADAAAEAAPGFAMPLIFKAHLYGLATEPAANAAAKGLVAQARALPLNDREASHVAALVQLLGGNWTAAALALDHHSMLYPHDLLALQSGHLMDFFRASARDLRDRIARALPHWDAGRPGHSVLLGMHAFGLEETGDYARAEAAGREALDRQPLDAWAHHAVAHVMEMQGRAGEGIDWMSAREASWSGDDAFFRIHNWWHKALCHLELEEGAEALALYDGPIRGSRSPLAVNLADASALLWRIHLAGHEVGDRWEELARAWDRHADGRLYPFNDLHAAMAWLGAGREAEVTRILGLYRADPDPGSEAAVWARATGLPLIEGFAAFWRGDHARAVERLFGARHIVNSFGGSHAPSATPPAISSTSRNVTPNGTS
jgi:tetratricopeptide (TPR) repeat protein